MSRYPSSPFMLELRSVSAAGKSVTHVLHLKPDPAGAHRGLSAGRLFREVCARGKAPTWREVPLEGPTYRAVLADCRHLDARIADLIPDAEQPEAC